MLCEDPPMEQLPDEFAVHADDKRGDPPEMLNFGFAVTSDHLINYALKHRLIANPRTVAEVELVLPAQRQLTASWTI